MKPNNKMILMIVFVIVIVLLLVFGGMAMAGARLNGGMMSDVSWMGFPIAIALGLEILPGRAIFGKN
jgi:hypothetical protein